MIIKIKTNGDLPFAQEINLDMDSLCYVSVEQKLRFRMCLYFELWLKLEFRDNFLNNSS